MAQQPRKFVEKMALLREKERQQSMAVEQVLREVRGIKVGVYGDLVFLSARGRRFTSNCVIASCIGLYCHAVTVPKTYTGILSATENGI